MSSRTEVAEAVSELNRVIILLEAEVPANIESPKNKKLAAKLERDVAKYFKSLEQAIDYGALENLYYKRVEQE